MNPMTLDDVKEEKYCGELYSRHLEGEIQGKKELLLRETLEIVVKCKTQRAPLRSREINVDD